MSKKLVGDVGTELRSQVVKWIATAILIIFVGAIFRTIQLAAGDTQTFSTIAIVSLGLISVGQAIYIWRSKPSTTTSMGEYKSGDIFWLCNDMRHAMAMISSGSMVQIIDGLERVHHHATQIGLILDGKKVDRLWSLRNEAIGAVSFNWSSEKRQSVWQELDSFFNDAAQEIQRKQKGFIPDPPLQYKPT